MIAHGTYTYQSWPRGGRGILLALEPRQDANRRSNDDMDAGRSPRRTPRIDVPSGCRSAASTDTRVRDMIWPELTTSPQPVAAMGRGRG